MVYKANGIKRDTNSMIVHAKQLYNLATKYPGSYASAPDSSCLGIHKVGRAVTASCCCCENDTARHFSLTRWSDQRLPRWGKDGRNAPLHCH